MRSAFHTLYRLYGQLLTGIAVAAGFALFLLMLLVVANALTRKLINWPILGTQEITEALMPLIILLPLGFTQLQRGHIRVQLLTDRLPHGARRLIYILTLAIGCAFFAWVAWATYLYGLRAIHVGETAWGLIRFPIWPSKMGVALGAVLLSIQFLLDIVKSFVDGDDGAENHEAGAPGTEALHG